jgi:hypothetical protein
MPDGKLHPDPDHLPFVPRVLLDPSIGDRAERWPTPIASLNEYDRTIRKMDVDRQEGWQARLQHAKEMFEEVAGIAINEWSHKGWQREKPVVVPWERHPDSAKRILPLCEAWLQAETLPGALTAILKPADKPSRIGPAIEADQRHLGHCGDSLNSEQRDAVRAVRLRLSAPRDPRLARKETSFAVWGSPAQAHAAAIEAEFAALNAVPQERRP